MKFSGLKKIIWPGIFAACGFAAGFFGRWLIDKNLASQAIKNFSGQIVPLRTQDNQYKFVHPLLAYRLPEGTSFFEFQSLKKHIEDKVAAARAAGEADDVSVYFRDFDKGRWLGLNQNAAYNPGSLLKVPLMIFYFKQAENDPGLLDRELKYEHQPDSGLLESPSELVLHNSYTVERLIEAMIKDSDNGAMNTLLDNADSQALGEVYAALGIQDPNSASANQYVISTRTYSLFFRILYDSTYLIPQYSEKALEILAEATFKDGLAAGLPEGTAVAHKFGEHVISQGQKIQEIELHDCGIVYSRSSPYLLCVMTRGKDLGKLQSTIASLAKTVDGDLKEDSN